VVVQRGARHSRDCQRMRNGQPGPRGSASSISPRGEPSSGFDAGRDDEP
jgi:hypothetical protein